MEFAKPQKLPDGRYFLKIKSPLLQLNNVKYHESSLDVPEAYTSKFDALDEQILTEAKKSKVEWFGRDLSDETIQGAYQTSLTDGALGVSLAKVKGEVIVRAFGSQKEEMALSNVVEGSQCDVLVELAGLWFLKKSFGPVWRVLQVRVRNQVRPPVRPTQYMFEDEDEVEDEDDPADYVD
jgi:hypothetical protein